jgi:hypothetical protein
MTVKARFTLDGSDALEGHLAQTCQEVLAGVRSLIPLAALEALVLGGGYGRGHGGVLKTENCELPYNDLEFYVFIRGSVLWSERRYRDALEELGEHLSSAAGLHVEFKVYSAEKLRREPISMFTYDLASGHKIIFGSEEIFAGCEHHLAAEKIPAHEATRLLFNRCSGLLLAGELLRRDARAAGEKDFIGRNLAKAQLAFGDAVLTIFGQYHWSCLKRYARLNELKDPALPQWIEKVREHHANGVEFKLHPTRTTETMLELQNQHTETTGLGLDLWLWTEGRRLNRRFSCAREYALAVSPKCPETAAWRNCLLNLRSFGAGALRDGRIFCHPRERLFDALCLLLWDEPAAQGMALRRRLQHNLRAKTSRSQDLIPAYKNIWQSYG